jgi:transcriptional regulator with GAF, ATPase, and Fis domain
MKETIPGQIDLIADIVETLLVPGKLIYKILSAIVSLADCERAVAFVMAPGNRLEPKAQVGVSPNNLNTIRDVLNSYASEHPRSSSLVYLPDTRKDEKFRKISILKGADILSFACVPLKLEGESYGVLYLDSTSHTRILSSMDLERINRYSRLITLAILREQKLGDAEFNIATVSVNDYLAERTIDELEKQQLQSLLEKNNWNVTKTAQLMQMPRRTLYNKMTKYGIKRPKRGRHEAAAVA